MRNLHQIYSKGEVYPPIEQIYRALELCPTKNVKVVILGQDPYHTPGAANGLAFSVNKGVRIPPSLQNIYKELSNDMSIPMPTHGDLTSWAKQGVLLLNTVLTVEKGKPMSHAGLGWEKVTDDIIFDLSLMHQKKPIVFILWGKKAQEKIKLIDHEIHPVIQSAHPSPFSADKGFFGSSPFSNANRYLKIYGHEPIDWSVK